MADHIKAFWEDQARVHGPSHEASWGDSFAIELEIETIGAFIGDGDAVLDVGCANGFSTVRHLQRGVRRIVGVDFSEAMIAQAEALPLTAEERARVEFSVGDVRELDFAADSFDVVYTTRVLINLPTWQQQQQGVDECLRVGRPGGRVILSEGFWEPLMLLNAMRALVQLPPLVEHDFNRYLKQERLESLLQERGLSFERIDFSSVYYLGSRFLRELATDADAFPGYSNPINEAFFHLERDYSGGGFGVQQAYAIDVP